MMTNYKWFLAGTVLTASFASSAQVSASEGEELLKSMQSAVHSLSYTGKLVFSKGSELSVYQIEHQSGQGNGAESVIKLDKGSNTAPNQQQFSLLNSKSLRLPDQKAYSIDMGGDAKVAGQPCKVVVVRPKDKMRYLHRYCISPENGMLLRYSVMNRQQQLLEQFMFTQLEIGGAVNAVNQDKQSIKQQSAESITDSPMPDQWDFSALPAGFRVNQVEAIPGKSNAHQIVLTDGLTFVSVFIEPGEVSGDIDKQLPASGATNILTHKTAQHTVTLVGEVPQETLQAIQNGLRYVTP